MIRCLDLFCGVGGAGEGYQRAGFEVVGVDIVDQPNNPHQFIKGDALEYLMDNYMNFDFIHASPPCQLYSVASAPMRAKGKKYPDLVIKTQKLLRQTKKPYCIENVKQAPHRKDISLVGYLFGLKIIKERAFELGGVFAMQPTYPPKGGTVKNGDYISVVGHGGKYVPGGRDFKYWKGSVLDTWRWAMDMPFAKKRKELANAIPPAYTEYIANQIKHQLK